MAQQLINSALSKKKVSEMQLMEFKMECKSFLQALVKKMLSKSPLKYCLVQSLVSLSPSYMKEQPGCSRARISAHKMYIDDLEKKQQEKEKDKERQKRKVVEEDVDKLKKRKLLQTF